MSMATCEALDQRQVLPTVAGWLQEDRQVHEQLYMSTMCLNPADPQVSNLISACIDSCRAGRAIGAAVDAYTLLEPRAKGPLVSRCFKDATGRVADRERSIAELTEAGVDVSIVNDVGLVGNLYTSRLHIKAHVLGDDLIVGGPNMDGTSRFDLGIRLRSQPAARFMRNILGTVIDSGTTKSLGRRDLELSIDGNTRILVDVGRQGQSCIYDAAMDTVNDARDYLVYCSQYPPTGTERKQLERAAQRGVRTYVISNDSAQHAHFPRLVRAGERLRGLRPHTGLTHIKGPIRRPKIHTKALITENTYIVGSHNFTKVGVWLGVSEASIVQHDPATALQIARVVLSQSGISDEAVDQELTDIGWATVR